MNHTELIARLSDVWAQLDPVDEWRPVIRDAIDALAQPAAPAADIDEAQIARMHERGAVAWAGVDAADLRAGGDGLPAAPVAHAADALPMSTAEEIGHVTVEQARTALDNMDDYARMRTSVDAYGPRMTLEAFINQVAAPVALSDERIDAIADLIVKGMPDGIQGFLNYWGWRQFARALLEDCAGHCRTQVNEPVAWRVEFGAVGLPEGHPSRITCVSFYETEAEAQVSCDEMDFNSIITPLYAAPQPAPARVPLTDERLNAAGLDYALADSFTGKAEWVAQDIADAFKAGARAAERYYAATPAQGEPK